MVMKILLMGIAGFGILIGSVLLANGYKTIGYEYSKFWEKNVRKQKITNAGITGMAIFIISLVLIFFVLLTI